MAHGIAGILLDLGETLLTFGRVDVPALFREGSRLAYDHLCRAGHKLPPFGRYHRSKLFAIRYSYVRGRLAGREFDVLALLRRMHRRLGIDLSLQQALELAGMWYEPLGRMAVVERGTIETLTDLRGRGLTLGLVSNTFIPADVLDEHLRREGLIDLLPTRVYSSRLIYRKPDRRIFEAALQQARLPAARTLFVGDSLLADIRGANRAGLISVLKDSSERKWLWRFRPRHRIARIEELRRIVEEYDRP
jgi:HAD superfamily hydrolase (TIGR01509 family)